MGDTILQPIKSAVGSGRFNGPRFNVDADSIFCPEF